MPRALKQVRQETDVLLAYVMAPVIIALLQNLFSSLSHLFTYNHMAFSLRCIFRKYQHMQISFWFILCLESIFFFSYSACKQYYARKSNNWRQTSNFYLTYYHVDSTFLRVNLVSKSKSKSDGECSQSHSMCRSTLVCSSPCEYSPDYDIRFRQLVFLVHILLVKLMGVIAFILNYRFFTLLDYGQNRN